MMRWMMSLLFAAMFAVSFATVSTAEDVAVVQASKIEVEIQIGTGLDKADPTGVAESFPVSVGQLVGWTRVKGAASPIVIKHAWSLNGEEKSEVELPVKSTSYRTWSRKTLFGLTGKWRLDVRGPDGAVVASKEVTVVQDSDLPAPAAPQAQ